MTDMAMDAVVAGNRLEMAVSFTLQGRALEALMRHVVSRTLAVRQCLLVPGAGV